MLKLAVGIVLPVASVKLSVLNEKKSSIGFQAINALGQGSVALSDSIGQLCGNLKTVAAGATAINLALSSTCERMVGLCKNECGELVEEIKNAKAEIQERAT